MKAEGRFQVIGRMLYGILLIGVLLASGVSVGQAADCARFSDIAYKYHLDTNHNMEYESSDASGMEEYYAAKSGGDIESPLFTYTVEVSAGAIVTCQINNKKAVVLNPDEEDTENEVDYYNFCINKPGVAHKITAKLGDDETTLTFQVEKPKTETVGIKNAKYDPTQGSYGIITADNKVFRCYAGNDSIAVRNQKVCQHNYDWNKELTKEEELERWKLFLASAVKRGKTITLVPAVSSISYASVGNEKVFNYGSVFSLRSGLYLKYSGAEYREYFDGSRWHYEFVYGKDITASLYELRVKQAKIKIPAQKNAPKIKVDAIKGTLSTTSAQEYAVRSEASETAEFSEWTDASKKMTFSQISCPNGILSGASIRIRTKATPKSLSSRYTTIVIPAQTMLDASTITAKGTVTDASISIGKFDKTTNPYEYTTTKPSDSSKWISVSSNTLSFKGKKSFPGTIYLREKGIKENTKKSLSLKLPSSYVTITYDTASQTWDVQ